MTDESEPTESSTDDDASVDSNRLVRERIAKYQQVMEDGGFPYSYSRTHTAAQIAEQFPDLEPGASTGETATVAGRLKATREMGKLIFAPLTDGSGTVQLFVDKRTLGDEMFEAFRTLDIGDWIGATGEVITSKRGELSVRISAFTLLQKSLRTPPDKWHGLKDVEQRSRRRYVDLLANEESRNVALTRATIVRELRRQFEQRGYIEVETPVLLTQATGAAARAFSTTHNALDMDMYLRIATELYLKRLVVGGLERVFEIGRIFRNEGVDATHNPEFTMLESYEAFADYNDMMVLVEEIVAACAVAATGSASISYSGKTIDLSGPYRRATMLKLTQEAVGEDITYDTPVDELRTLAQKFNVTPQEHWGTGALVESLFDALVENTLWEPTFVTEHPIETSPLARVHRDKPHVTERFELFIAGDEYANAFSELNDPFDQRARFEAQAMARAAGDDEAHPIDEDYILALEYGLPPTGGLGLGVDRLVMLLTDKQHIREVILFPTMRPEG